MSAADTRRALALSVFLVKPGGILALPLGSAPAVVAVYVAIAAAAWHVRRRRDGGSGETGHPSPTLSERADSALVRT